MVVSPASAVFFGFYLLIMAILFIGALLETMTPTEKGRPGNPQPPAGAPANSNRIYWRHPRMDYPAILEGRLNASCSIHYQAIVDNAIKKIRL